MKESMWGYYLVLLGIFVSTFMIMITNMTTTNQQDYYLLKEVTNAAMIDAIDYGYYREYGEMKINTEKFVENFMRRFSEGISKSNTYKVDFYSIYENPPSVSVRVSSQTSDYRIFGDTTHMDVVNSIDAILEANNVITIPHKFYSIPYGSCSEGGYITLDTSDKDYGYCQLTNRAALKLDVNSIIYDEIKQKRGVSSIDTSKIKILSVDFLRVLSEPEDLEAYGNQYGTTYNRLATLDDVPDSIPDQYKYFAKKVKDVNVTVKKDSDNNYYLAYGLKYNCEGVSTYKYYRDNRITTVGDPNLYISETLYNTYSDAEKANYSKAPFYNNCLIGIEYNVNFYYDA